MPRRDKQTANERLKALAAKHASTKAAREKGRNRKRSPSRAAQHPDEGRPVARRPLLDAGSAMEFVKLLASGVPATLCLSYFSADHYESLTEKQRQVWLGQWARSPLVVQAAADFNKGVWQDLDKDARLQIALDKHLAELAHYLYTHSFETAQGLDYKKLADAREALMAHLDAAEGEPDGPFQRMMRELLAGKVEADGPPQIPAPAPAPTSDTHHQTQTKH